MDIFSGVDLNFIKEIGNFLQKYIETLKNLRLSHEKDISEFADEVLKVLSEKLPYIEKVLWQAIEAVFAPRHFARQLAAIFIVQAVVVTWKTTEIMFSKVTARMKKEWRVIKQVEKQMRLASSYGEWKRCAELADKLQGADVWRQDPDCRFYDREVLQHRIDELNELMAKGDIFYLIFTLRGGLSRPQYGMLHEGLYSKALSGTKVMVEDYLETVCRALVTVCEADCESEQICTDTKLAFFNELRHAYGRTALLLSGGASLGFYHMGVVKALIEQGLLPRVISGASAGSIVAAMVGTRTDMEIHPMLRAENIITTFFKPERTRHQKSKSKGRQSAFWSFLVPPALRAFASGLLSIFVYNENILKMDTEYFRSVLRHNIGNYTFQEAFDRTGRIINITVSPINKTDPPRLLNYLTSPHVIVWSAAVCSASVPGVFDPSTLLVKDPDGSIRPESSTGLTFCDGSMEADLPMDLIAELFNINHFIISQVNPHAALLSNVSLSRSVWENPIYGFITALLGFMKSQVRAWTKHVVDLVILRRQAPSWSTRRGVGQLLTQEYEGRDQDITILPWFGHETIIGAFTNMLSNPSKDGFTQYVTVGDKNVYPHVNRITCHCKIEMTLENCVKTLRARLAAEDKSKRVGVDDLVTNRDRTPSFYTSRSLVGLSGLCITDPARLGSSLNPTIEQLNSSDGSDLFGSSEHQALAEEDFSQNRNEANLLAGDSLATPLHTQAAGSNFVKSTSMANFYYRRAGSFDLTTPQSNPITKNQSNSVPDKLGTTN